MKTHFQLLIVLSVILIGSANAESKFTKEQVIQLGRVILAAEVNKEYKGIFWDSQPEYDDKTQSWKFTPNVFPVTPCGDIHLFELREADGFYRLGRVSIQKSSSGYDKFRIQSSVRGKLTDLLETHKKP